MDKTLFFYIAVIVGVICTYCSMVYIYKITLSKFIDRIERRQVEYMESLFKDTLKINSRIDDKYDMMNALIIEQFSNKDFPEYGKKG